MHLNVVITSVDTQCVCVCICRKVCAAEAGACRGAGRDERVQRPVWRTVHETGKRGMYIKSKSNQIKFISGNMSHKSYKL